MLGNLCFSTREQYYGEWTRAREDWVLEIISGMNWTRMRSTAEEIARFCQNWSELGARMSFMSGITYLEMSSRARRFEDGEHSWLFQNSMTRYNISFIPWYHTKSLIFSWTSGQENKSCGKNCKDLITNSPCFIETWAKRQIFDRMWMKSRTSCTEPSTLWRCPTGQVDHSLDPGPDKHSSPLKLSDSRIFTPRASWT